MAGAGGHEVERLAVKVVPDTGDFKEKLKAFLEKVEEQSKIEVELELKDEQEIKAKLKELAKDLTVKLKVELENEAEVRRKLAALVRDRTMNLEVDIDTTFIKAKLAEISRNRALTVNVDLDLAAARVQLAIFLRPRTLRVRVDLDRNNFGLFMQGMQQMAAMLGMMSHMMRTGQMFGQAFQLGTQGAQQFGRSLGPLKILIGVVLVAAIAVLVGALAGIIIIAGAVIGALLAIVPVVGLVAAGVVYLLQSSDRSAKAFRKNLEGIGNTAKKTLSFAVQPMSKAIAAQMPVIQRWVGTLDKPLRRAFAGASKYADELTLAMIAFSNNALKGVTEALENPAMQQAVNGFRKLFADLGTAIGQFFATLAKGGADYGKTFSALGEALKLLLPAFAELLNAFAGEAPDLIRTFALALKMLFDIFKDKENLAAISDFAKVSFAILFATLATIVTNIRWTVDLWRALYNAAVWVVNAVIGVWNKCVDWLQQKWNQIKSNASSIASETKSVVVANWRDMVSTIQGVLDGFTGWISGLWARITGRSRSGANNAKMASLGPFNDLASSISGIMDRIVGIVTGAWSRISGIASRISGLISSIASKASTIGGILDKIPFFSSTPEAIPEGARTSDRSLISFDLGPVSTFKGPPVLDSVDQLSRVSANLRAKYVKATSGERTPSQGRDSLAAKVYNFTTYAAPNEPTEKQFVKWLDYADTLYAA
ncbi:phage tail protein [Spirillospora sp. CA-294931]|uniref:phage tail protein n=1 Tax=Spirillospora sp. CA-294931 TaxID=3240042 RepID=UPI003D9052EF